MKAEALLTLDDGTEYRAEVEVLRDPDAATSGDARAEVSRALDAAQLAVAGAAGLPPQRYVIGPSGVMAS